MFQGGVDGDRFGAIALDHRYGKLGLVAAADVDDGGVRSDQVVEEKKVRWDTMDSQPLQMVEPCEALEGSDGETGHSAR